MEREKLLKEYEDTLESLVEKTKFVYSEEFYALDEFEKQKYTKDKMATEGHLSSLSNLLWGKTPQIGGFGDALMLGFLGSMFSSGMGLGSSSPGVDYLKKQRDEGEKKEQDAVYAIPVGGNKDE